MRIEEVKVFQYDELTIAGKENARKWYKETLNEDFSLESELITEMFQNELENKGYDSVEVNWSLSCCQGDGVAFYGTLYTGEVLDIADRLLNKKEYSRLQAIAECENITIQINKCNSRYDHWNSMEVELVDTHMYEDFPKVYELLIKVEKAIQEDVRELSRELEKLGYEEIEYHYSLEAIEDAIRSNDYEFTEDGNKF